MRKRRRKTTELAKLSVDQRIDHARRKTNTLVDIWIELVNIQATNRYVVYSRDIAKQIPRSVGAHAFAYLQSSLMRYEIVRLCTLFDPCQDDDLDKVSIPAVLNLLRDTATIEKLSEITKSQWRNRRDKVFAEKQADLTAARLRFASRWGAKAGNCPALLRVRNLRDKHLAHTLEMTRIERKRTVSNPRYGDERKLLSCARRIINALHLSVNSASYDWDLALNISHRRAAALWNGTRFGATE